MILALIPFRTLQAIYIKLLCLRSRKIQPALQARWLGGAGAPKPGVASGL